MIDDLKEKPSSEQERNAELLADAFRQVLSLPSGKRVLFWVLEQCAIYSDGYTGDTNSTNYVLGQQAVGKRIVLELDTIDPLIYPNMLLDIAKLKNEEKILAQRGDEQEQEDDAPYV